MRIRSIWFSAVLGMLTAPAAPVLALPISQNVSTAPTDEATQSYNMAAARNAEKARDYRRAYALWTPLAEAGVPEAQYRLSLLYLQGKGVCEDKAKAEDWLSKAAASSWPQAQTDVGRSYYFGKNDHATGVAWFLKAANQGNAEAQYFLGRHYSGQTKPDYAQAASWFRKAAEQDYLDAEYELGRLYGQGLGVARDYAQAASWYRKAADQGHGDAQFELASLYEKGAGLPEDYVQAYKWYELAATSDFNYHTAGYAARDKLAASMTPDQVAEAKKLIAESRSVFRDWSNVFLTPPVREKYCQ